MMGYLDTLDMLTAQPMMEELIETSVKADLPNWSIVGGLIRDFSWGIFFGRSITPRDIDLIYYDDTDISPETDWEIENSLQRISGLPFRVRNQARMHIFNNEDRYCSVVDAMSKFPTTVSAIGITSDGNRVPVIFSVFGYESLFSPSFQITPHFFRSERRDDFLNYLERNSLRQRWPEVPVRAEI